MVINNNQQPKSLHFVQNQPQLFNQIGFNTDTHRNVKYMYLSDSLLFALPSLLWYNSCLTLFGRPFDFRILSVGFFFPSFGF